ncbi:MAG: hypothetical protein HRT64_12340 [Erythrobacter sp.]|nr:hypothetical protein [Erythrobacter sp.]
MNDEPATVHEEAANDGNTCRLCKNFDAGNSWCRVHNATVGYDWTNCSKFETIQKGQANK